MPSTDRSANNSLDIYFTYCLFLIFSLVCFFFERTKNNGDRNTNWNDVFNSWQIEIWFCKQFFYCSCMFVFLNKVSVDCCFFYWFLCCLQLLIVRNVLPRARHHIWASNLLLSNIKVGHRVTFQLNRLQERPLLQTIFVMKKCTLGGCWMKRNCGGSFV